MSQISCRFDVGGDDKSVEGKYKVVIGIFLGAVILTLLLLAFRTTAIKSAYDASASYNVTDSEGVTHLVPAGVISGDSVASLYGLATGFVWLIAVVAIIIVLVKF